MVIVVETSRVVWLLASHARTPFPPTGVRHLRWTRQMVDRFPLLVIGEEERCVGRGCPRCAHPARTTAGSRAPLWASAGSGRRPASTARPRGRRRRAGAGAGPAAARRVLAGGLRSHAFRAARGRAGG